MKRIRSTMLPRMVMTAGGACRYAHPATGEIIGIDDRSGSSTLHGTLTFRLDNTAVLNPEKHLWLELRFLVSPNSNLRCA